MTRYTSERAAFSLLMPALALAVVLGGSTARADDLDLGGNYNTFNFNENGSIQSLGAGSITVSSLNSVTLAWVYCVDLLDTIAVPANYDDTTTTNNGVVNGVAVNNDGEVAWLLDAYATSSEGNVTDQEALQASIWTTIYGHNYNLNGTGDSTALVNQYNADLAALGSQTASLSNIDWFTPSDGSSTKYQGLVGPNMSPVPEPMSIFLLGTVLLCVLSLLKRKLATGEQR
jgi:hypothetical protein